MSFIDFAAVKARCSIEQAAKLIGLQTTEERSQLRTPCPVCGGAPRAIVITPLKNLFHCFPVIGRWRSNRPGQPRQRRGSKGRGGLPL